MSETDEPPAKVLKIDNFDQELSIPEIEPIGNGTTVPDGLGDAASVVDGDIPERLGHEETDVTGEIADNDLTDAEDKEIDQETANLAQNTDKIEQDITDTAMKLPDEIIDQDPDNFDQDADKMDQDADKTDQDADKTDQDEDKTDQDMEKLHGVDKVEKATEELDQEEDKTGQDQDKTGQDQDKTDQEASVSQDEVEGHEEWLSEGILTDDDLNANVSRPHSEDDKPLQKSPVKLESRIVEQNIEETLTHLDSSSGMLDRKFDKNMVIKDEPILMKQEPDDGNDTDDLLRMLGEDSQSKTKKKLTKTVKDLRNAMKNVMEGSDDEDFQYDQTSIRKLKVAKNAISKKPPPKAVAEDMDDGDDDDTDRSSDEDLATLKKTFNMKKTNIVTKKLPPRETQNLVVVKKATTNKQPPVNVVSRRDVFVEKPVQKKSSTMIKSSNRSILKTSTPAKMVASKPNPTKPTRIEFKPPTSVSIKPTPTRAEPILKTIEMKQEDPDDEYLDEQDCALNDDFESDIEDSLSRQRIMKPERMDEEVPSDEDSCDEDGSLYDELPSSESDDMDDWFQIDIRAERASEYIPLLGLKAKELLLEEKKRTALRVANLRSSLSALTESGKKQAEELRKATMSLAELDDMLKAT